MNKFYLLPLSLLAILITTNSILGQESESKTIPLWPAGKVPEAKGDSEADIPSIIVYQPPVDKRTDVAVVICPGGGYGHLAIDHEGHQVARWLNSLGVTGIILKYRIAPKYHHPAPITDAQRAIRFTRSHAKKWGIDPNKIGILGFSAGGHLASTAATHTDLGIVDGKDKIDQESCRPDFAVLCYPVITFTNPAMHKGSRRNLLATKQTDEKMIRLLSNELQVSKNTPPTFLVHTTEDKGVPPENSILFYQACVRAGVPVEMHLFEKGRHGLGLGTPGTAFALWPGICAHWLRERGILKRNGE